MKLKTLLSYKIFLIALLFVNGLIIVATVFPAINILYSAAQAKNKRDALKTRWLSRFADIIKLQVNVEGVLPKKGALLVGNHISWLDIIVIGQHLPVYFVAKSDISSWPVIGYLAKQSGTIFIRRGDKRHIQTISEKMAWLLRQNSNLVVFPEGTTTQGDEVLPFHASLLQPALLTKSVIQPVALKYQGAAKQLAPFVGDDAFVPHLIKMLALDKIEVQLSFLPVINDAGKNRYTLSIETREMILEKISEQLPKSHQDSHPVEVIRQKNHVI